MNKNFLSKEQVELLNEKINGCFKEKFNTYSYNSEGEETLSTVDILNILPKKIVDGDNQYYLRLICLSDNLWEVDYFLINYAGPRIKRNIYYETGKEIIDVLFTVLLYCVENNKFEN